MIKHTKHISFKPFYLHFMCNGIKNIMKNVVGYTSKNILGNILGNIIKQKHLSKNVIDRQYHYFGGSNCYNIFVRHRSINVNKQLTNEHEIIEKHVIFNDDQINIFMTNNMIDYFENIYNGYIKMYDGKIILVPNQYNTFNYVKFLNKLDAMDINKKNIWIVVHWTNDKDNDMIDIEHLMVKLKKKHKLLRVKDLCSIFIE